MTPQAPLSLNCGKCNNPFTKQNQAELILVTSLTKDDVKATTLKQSKIFFVLKGLGVLCPGGDKKLNLQEGCFILLPMGCLCGITAKTDMLIMEIPVDEIITTSDVHFYNSGKAKISGKSTPYVMGMNDKVWLYATNTMEFIKDDLSCQCYHRMKIKELLHILRMYYPAESLAKFYQPLNSKNARFSMTVYENWDKIDSLNELADLTGLSLSGFSKKFSRLFGVSAYQWIMDKKGERIIDELYNGQKSMKELTEEYGFYSVQHFGYYCKQRFGSSPGKIRQSSKRSNRPG